MDLFLIIAVLGGLALFLIGVVIFAGKVLSYGLIGVVYVAVIGLIYYIRWRRNRY